MGSAALPNPASRAVPRPPLSGAWWLGAERPLQPWLGSAAVLLPPFVALATVSALWPWLQPFAWALFFPAVFVSAWVAGSIGGAVAGLISSALITSFFVPVDQPVLGVLVPTGALTGTGVFVGALQRRVRAARDRFAAAADAARTANTQLEMFIALAPDGIFVANLDGRYTHVNEAGGRMLGYTREELVGKSILDLIPQQDFDRLRRSREELLAGAVHVAEWVLRRKDGTDLPVEVSARILPDGRWLGFVRDVGERQRIELALHRSEDDLRRAQAVARVGSWRLDVRKNELLWSDEEYRIFGVPRGTPMTYEAFLATCHPEDREHVDRQWKAALRGEPYDCEHRVIAEGEVRWVRERAELAFEPDGSLIGGIGTTQDITEHKRIEDELRRARDAEQRLRAELEAVSRAEVAVAEAVVSAAGPDLTTVLNMIALQARALTGARYVAVGVGTDPQRPFSSWLALDQAATEEAVGRLPRPIGTLGLVSRDGQVVRVADVRRHPAFRGLPPGHPDMSSFLGVPIRYRGRAVGNLFLANEPGGREFSEEDERRVQLLAARTGVAIETASLYAGEAGRRAWLQTVIEQMPDAVVIVDPEGGLVLQNHAATTLFPGRSPLSYELLAPSGEVVPDPERPLRRALGEAATIVREEHVVRTPSGERIPVLVSATPIRVGAQIAGAVAVFQDLREQKELERLREEWTSIVAHDLRQPVNTIQLSTDLLLSLRAGGPSTRQEQELLERVRECARRLGRMINDLLDASRVEAERLSIEPRLGDLGALVDRTVSQLSPALTDHTVGVTGAAAEAWFDAGRVQQVLENLLTNAAKYGRPGTPIGVELATRETEVEVAVSNEGPGIPADELARLFSRFSRTHGARASGRPGLGLGLYVSRGLVQAHGGRLWAESQPGGLTRFRFTLPRKPPGC